MIRTLLVDEQKVIREGLRVLLESESDIEIVAAVSNGYAAISKIDETNPDILFISIKLSEMEGLDVLAIIRKKYPQIKIIIFSDQANEQHLVQSLEMGIKGYLLKDSPMEEIVETIYAVDKGYIHVANDALSAVIPQISQTLNELNQPKPEIIFSDTSEYQELPQWENQADSTQINYHSEAISTYEETASNGQSPVIKSTEPLAVDIKDTKEIDSQKSSFSLPLESENSDNQGSKYFSVITLASLGILAISLIAISAIFRRSPQVVIENAVINGKTISISSPILGKLTEVNYNKGSLVMADSTIATIEPIISDRIKQEQNQIEAQIKLKKQQQSLAQQSLSFLTNNLQNLEQESSKTFSATISPLLANFHLNQIKYQETALQTAQIREDATRNNYEDLKELYQQQKIPEAQLNLAKNSWELATAAIEEIQTNLSNTLQEYTIVQQQLAGNNRDSNNYIFQEKSLLNQQVENQKITLNLLQSELEELENKLTTFVTQSAEKQLVSLKTPITGSFYNQKYVPGDVVNASEPIATIIDCNNLWVEATVDPKVTTQINTQEPVVVTISNQNISLPGKITLIESINIEETESNSSNLQVALATEIPPQAQASNYSRVIVTVPSSFQQLHEQEFCSVGQTAQLFFGKEKESLISQWQPQWLSKIFATQSQ